MSVGLRAARPLGILLKPQVSIARTYSTIPPITATTSSETFNAPEQSPLEVSEPSVADSEYLINVSTVLSRPPMLTPPLTPFEESFYFYHRRLNARLALPFPRYFYFKKGTASDAEWKRKQRSLGRDRWTGFGPRSWADELLVGDESHKDAEGDGAYRRLVAQTVTGEEGEEKGSEKGVLVDVPLPRKSQADIEGDRRSLNREMSRTLYLLVRRSTDGKWQFPTSPIVGEENLRQAAERTLSEAAGVNMNTWFVGNVPIGHYVHEHGKRHVPRTDGKRGEKVFFMKARIMTGQADLKSNLFGLDDFAWATKEEVHDIAGSHYYYDVRNLLVSI